MRYSNIAIGASIAIFVSVFAHGDYLSSKFSGNNDTSAYVKGNSGQHKVPDENITDKEAMSLALLSFEQEEELKKKQKALAAKRRQEEKLLKQKKEEERKKREAKMASQNRSAPTGKFPTLEEQMRIFKSGGALPPLVNGEINQHGRMMLPSKSEYYGTLCRGNKCYLLGAHKLYKEGDIVSGKKIMEITTDFVRFNDQTKEWFTR